MPELLFDPPIDRPNVEKHGRRQLQGHAIFGRPFRLNSWPMWTICMIFAILITGANWCKEKMGALFGHARTTHFGFSAFGPAVRVFILICHDVLNSYKQQ